MPAYCAVKGCRNRGERDKVSFYRFPAILKYKYTSSLNDLSVKRQNCWIRALQRRNLTENKLKYATVCSKHFISGKSARLEDKDDPDWVPSLYLGYDTEENLHNEQDLDTLGIETEIVLPATEDSTSNITHLSQIEVEYTPTELHSYEECVEEAVGSHEEANFQWSDADIKLEASGMKFENDEASIKLEDLPGEQVDVTHEYSTIHL